MILIIGGGFFGMYIAEHFARHNKDVMLCEKDEDFMTRASYANQARVHNGYHYPRSVLTALRSRISFPRFCAEFPSCIDSSFEKYYLVGRLLSKVTARQFERFCDRIGAPCEVAPGRVKRLVNPRLVEEVFLTTEFAFDAVKLRQIMKARLEEAGVTVRLGTTVTSLRSEGGRISATLSHGASRTEPETVHAHKVFNCTYSMLNFVCSESGIAAVPLKKEMTEMCLVEVPDELKSVGLTVMCGPFFSVMPFPSRGLHSFSHVRYTPHFEWHEGPGKPFREFANQPNRYGWESAWTRMRLDASRYVPLLSQCRYVDSIWETKAVLPRSEVDDSRPILFKAHPEIDGLFSVLGGKIDNIYEAVTIINELGLA